ncbi:hypothetical protein [Actinokineospora diospyrosa]|uniref:Uncharacterized protein n=1 Tax=Actinokineospora diospyrosa TaxID=103728 RepID=A0ABT1IDQ6_9PSEU|nr:hypothetical protein [Actinokineospora diospyrosa]MCP2270776.1 hypothetical protein [Actinokineospora diospyrosa]
MPEPRLARTAGALVLVAGLTAGRGSGSDDPATGTTRVRTADNGDITIPATPKRVVATGYAVPALLEAGALATFDTGREAYRTKTRELAAKYAGVLPRLRCAHLGAYGEIANGDAHREVNGSWGAYGQVEVKGGGSKDVSEYPSIEELPSAFGEAEVITCTVNAGGSTPKGVRYALDSPLWKAPPAVKAGKVHPLRYTEATTYGSALATAAAVDRALEPLLKS